MFLPGAGVDSAWEQEKLESDRFFQRYPVNITLIDYHHILRQFLLLLRPDKKPLEPDGNYSNKRNVTNCPLQTKLGRFYLKQLLDFLF